MARLGGLSPPCLCVGLTPGGSELNCPPPEREVCGMASRRKPWWGAGPCENFRQNVVQRFMNFDRDVANHVIGRNQSVAQVLGYMNLLYNAGLIPEGSQVVPHAARWQSLGGSRADGTEGAHCLPCQILVSLPGPARHLVDPSDLTGLSRSVREGVRTEFAHVTNLPAVFNSADIVAEQTYSGCAVFAATCQSVVSGPRRTAERKLFMSPNDRLTGQGSFRDVWLLDRVAVRAAYGDYWVPWAEMAYKLAMDEVERGHIAVCYLAPLHRTADPALVMEILNSYLKLHRTVKPSKLLDKQMNELEQVFNG